MWFVLCFLKLLSPPPPGVGLSDVSHCLYSGFSFSSFPLPDALEGGCWTGGGAQAAGHTPLASRVVSVVSWPPRSPRSFPGLHLSRSSAPHSEDVFTGCQLERDALLFPPPSSGGGGGQLEGRRVQVNQHPGTLGDCWGGGVAARECVGPQRRFLRWQPWPHHARADFSPCPQGLGMC